MQTELFNVPQKRIENKFTLSRKELSEKEAIMQREIIVTQIDNLWEENIYWTQRLNKPLSPIDQFILFSDKT